jgi:hypothetical protein
MERVYDLILHLWASSLSPEEAGREAYSLTHYTVSTSYVEYLFKYWDTDVGSSYLRSLHHSDYVSVHEAHVSVYMRAGLIDHIGHSLMWGEQCR